MPLYKIKDFNPDYPKAAFNGNEIKGMTVYTLESEEKIGSVSDILVDEKGHFRYLAIDMGFWIFGKKVLVPADRCRIDRENNCLYVANINSKDDVEELPEYEDSMVADYNYEQRVRAFYQTPSVENSLPVEDSLPVESSAAIEEEITTAAIATPQETLSGTRQSSTSVTSDTETYSHNKEPALLEADELKHQKIELYEERLIASKERHKSGDVSLNKRVETSTAHTAVPLEKERVVIERKTAGDEAATDKHPDFREGEVAHLEVYEETANVNKQAFVREEVEVKKEIVRDRFEASQKVRQEKLEVDVDGKPEIVD